MNRSFLALLLVTCASLGYAVCLQVNHGLANSTPAPMAASSRAATEDAVVTENVSAVVASELAAMRLRLNELSAEVAELRNQLKLAPPASTSVVTPRSPSNTLRDQTALEEEREARQGLIQEIETAFTHQRTDPMWASSVSSVIEDGLNANEGLRNVQRKVECRSQTCRVELIEEAPGQVAPHLRTLLPALGATLPSSTLDYVDQGNGRTKIVVFLGRNASPMGASDR